MCQTSYLMIADCMGSNPVGGNSMFLWARNFTLIAQYWLVPGMDLKVYTTLSDWNEFCINQMIYAYKQNRTCTEFTGEPVLSKKITVAKYNWPLIQTNRAENVLIFLMANISKTLLLLCSLTFKDKDYFHIFFSCWGTFWLPASVCTWLCWRTSGKWRSRVPVDWQN
jgi:hypothetical protein